MTAAILTQCLTKTYGKQRGIVNLDLEVPPGRVFGFLGPNGAGKSTTIRVLLDLIRPTTGQASVLGLDSRRDSLAIRRRSGYLPGELSLYPRLTGHETLRYFANLRGGVDRGYLDDLCRRLDFDAGRKVADLSTGMAINQAPNVSSFGLSSIKACVSGAAPLPVEVQEAFERLTRGRLVEGYGLTEASPVTHINPLEGARRVGSIGIPVPSTDAKIVDLATREDLPAGQIGELAVKGPQVMRGYWNPSSEDDTDSVLKDGWLYTGDVASMDADGFAQIISRKRDAILAGEYSVYPRDIEEVLYENSKVMEVAVVGVPSGTSGQKVKAFVVPRPGSRLSKEELLDLCRKRLAEYAVPWDIEFREELPKSFVGKVLRRLLVEK